MNRPIRSGDTARIVRGALGDKGPNVGKVVSVGLLAGEHSEHGNIWSVHGTGLVTEYGAVGGTLHCAQGWLQRIEPLPAKTLSKQELSALDA